MNIYLTNGTYNYLKTIKDKHEDERLILMENENNALLLHETSKKTIFSQPRKFKTINYSGKLVDKNRFYVLEHLPTTAESNKNVEHELRKADLKASGANVYEAIRFLKQEKSNNFVILTMWSSEKVYEQWKKLSPFKFVYEQIVPISNFNYKGELFANPTYITTYKIRKEDDDQELKE